MKTRRTLALAPSTSEPDAALVARVAAGELDALGALYDAYGAAVLRFATQLVGSGEADDVVQDTFLRAASVAARFDPAAVSARPWLFGIAVRIVQERRRSLRRFLDAVSRFGAQPRNESASVADERSDVTRALAALAIPKRTVLLLAEVEGFSCPEIAEMLEVPVGTVWTRLHHARKELRASWEREP